jgi:hypothetical protein
MRKATPNLRDAVTRERAFFPQFCLALWSRRSGVRLHAFNLIEVVLGLGLIAIGLLSAVGAFPMCLSATRDSIAESYASENADQLLHVLATALKMRNGAGVYQNWTDYGLCLPTDKPGATEPYSWTTLPWMSGDTSTFRCGGDNNQFYFVEQKPVGAKAPDFTAVYRVWRGPVMCATYQDGVGWGEKPVSDSIAVGLNIEIGWPANVPYARRAKALYHLEVYKPQS